MSAKSNESDDSETGGFAFRQIGALEVWGDERYKLQSFEDATWQFELHFLLLSQGTTSPASA